ncbi:MAG: hypothetical protein KDK51_03325 [Deltaproteobacteria bacterium]|nr:hypothetical protein [Deltaproteobacteria bacterium]
MRKLFFVLLLGLSVQASDVSAAVFGYCEFRIPGSKDVLSMGHWVFGPYATVPMCIADLVTTKCLMIKKPAIESQAEKYDVFLPEDWENIIEFRPFCFMAAPNPGKPDGTYADCRPWKIPRVISLNIEEQDMEPEARKRQSPKTYRPNPNPLPDLTDWGVRQWLYVIGMVILVALIIIAMVFAAPIEFAIGVITIILVAVGVLDQSDLPDGASFEVVSVAPDLSTLSMTATHQQKTYFIDGNYKNNDMQACVTSLQTTKKCLRLSQISEAHTVYIEQIKTFLFDRILDWKAQLLLVWNSIFGEE